MQKVALVNSTTDALKKT